MEPSTKRIRKARRKMSNKTNKLQTKASREKMK
jgi:hypothetical protein